MSPIDAFRRHSYLNLVTYRKTGVEVRTPTWFAIDGEKLYIFSAAKAGKVKRLRNSSRARVAPCDIRGKKILGDWHDASARLVTDEGAIGHMHQALRAKYGLMMRLGDLFATMIGRIHQRAYIEVSFGS